MNFSLHRVFNFLSWLHPLWNLLWRYLISPIKIVIVISVGKKGLDSIVFTLWKLKWYGIRVRVWVREKYGYGYRTETEEIWKWSTGTETGTEGFWNPEVRKEYGLISPLIFKYRTETGTENFFNLKYRYGFRTRLRTPGYAKPLHSPFMVQRRFMKRARSVSIWEFGELG